MIEAVQFYIDLSKVHGAMPEGVQANWGQAPSDLASGQTAMIVHSTGSLSGLLDQADFELGVMPIPGKEAGTYASVPGGGNLYIMDGVSDAEKAAAWQFIQFLTEPDRVADFSIQTGYIGARQSAYDTEAMQAYLAEVAPGRRHRGCAAVRRGRVHRPEPGRSARHLPRLLAARLQRRDERRRGHGRGAGRCRRGAGGV